MLLVVPISRADMRLASTVEKSFSLFPPGDEHDLLVVGSPNVNDEAQALLASIGKYFQSATFHILARDNHFGWPMACGYYFQQTCYFVATLPQIPWMWFELDCTPIYSGWLTKIKEAYNDTPNFFLGSKDVTVRGKNGKMLDVSESGYNMATCGVYPHDMPARILNLRAMHASYMRWNEFIQWYVVPSMSDTKLIQNNWRTMNYRREGSEIICDSDANLAWNIHYNSPILDTTVVVHGCKDGSLTSLLSHANDTVEPELPPIEQAPTVPQRRRISRAKRLKRLAKKQSVKNNG
jgi:hypothetical protein